MTETKSFQNINADTNSAYGPSFDTMTEAHEWLAANAEPGCFYSLQVSYAELVEAI